MIALAIADFSYKIISKTDQVHILRTLHRVFMECLEAPALSQRTPSASAEPLPMKRSAVV